MLFFVNISRLPLRLLCAGWLSALPIGSPAAAQNLGAEFQINSFTTGEQIYPAIAADGLGNFVVVWTGGEQDGSEFGVIGQRFTSTGSPLGGEFQVNTHTNDNQYSAAVASDP